MPRSSLASAAIASLLFGVSSCSDGRGSAVTGGQPSGGGAPGSGGLPGDAGASAAGAAGAAGSPKLLGAPLLFAPTESSFGISVVLSAGDPALLGARIRVKGESSWSELALPEVRATDLAQWKVAGLDPGTRYEYQIVSGQTDDAAELYEGSVLTARAAGESFDFALLSDTHVGAHLEFTNQGDPATVAAVSAEIRATAPDFVMNLGDLLDYHEYGFGAPPPDTATARLAYLNYRSLLGETAANAGHFTVLGNWDGESGAFTPEELARSRDQRLLYLPGPSPQTYAEGGSPAQDYYAFTWGDALFIVLNVMSYTPTSHLLSSDPGLPDDWTLGAAQLDWLSSTLVNASARWRFLFIHHTVAGKAGDGDNSAYGRGGGQAAHVGEQALVHQMMLDSGAQIFFYGHDHVFFDMVVDGIHYSEPGSAGAPWKFTTAETGYLQYWPDSGWARVEVTPQSVRVQFLAVGGAVLDEYTVD